MISRLMAFFFLLASIYGQSSSAASVLLNYKSHNQFYGSWFIVYTDGQIYHRERDHELQGDVVEKNLSLQELNYLKRLIADAQSGAVQVSPYDLLEFSFDSSLMVYSNTGKAIVIQTLQRDSNVRGISTLNKSEAAKSIMRWLNQRVKIKTNP